MLENFAYISFMIGVAFAALSVVNDASRWPVALGVLFASLFWMAVLLAFAEVLQRLQSIDESLRR